MVRIKDEFAGFLSHRFNRFLVAGLLVLGAILLLLPQGGGETTDGRLQVHFFYSPACPHCAAQEGFNDELERDFPDAVIVRHDVTIPAESRMLLTMAQNFSLGPEDLGTPATFVGNSIFIGYDPDLTGPAIRGTVAGCLSGKCPEGDVISSGYLTQGIDLPLIGTTDLNSLSLPVLAIVLGLVDGFNPCAMWVLVYLISLLMNLNDKRRLALITGTFVLASGVLYFLFMTAWLNAFLFLGYVRPVSILIGLVALGGGLFSIKEYLDTKGEMVCKITGVGDRKKLSARMRELVTAPLGWATFIAIVALAFTINSVEFVCSSAIPAVFTQILALKQLPWYEYYAYISLYDFFFMLDDFLVFGSALLVFGNIGEKYARYCKIIGGAILLLLGLMLLFAPQYLQ